MAQEFDEDIDRLINQYKQHSQNHGAVPTIGAFATWALLMIGEDRGRKEGYLEGVRAASKIINQMLPTFEPDGKESEDNATTIMLDRQP